jgi:hypothetical protein
LKKKILLLGLTLALALPASAFAHERDDYGKHDNRYHDYDKYDRYHDHDRYDRYHDYDKYDRYKKHKWNNERYMYDKYYKYNKYKKYKKDKYKVRPIRY